MKGLSKLFQLIFSSSHIHHRMNKSFKKLLIGAYKPVEKKIIKIENERNKKRAYFMTSLEGFKLFQARLNSSSKADAKNGVLTQIPTSYVGWTS